jgi:hypothetical protein
MTETALAELSVYNARPTVRINGQEDARLTALILAMEMTEQEGGMAALELRLSNIASDDQGSADAAFEQSRTLTLGAQVVVCAGDVSAPQEIFRGTITGFEAEFPEHGPPELVVLAEDVFLQARMARRTKVYDSIALADLAQRFAADLGLTPVISGLSEGLGTLVQLDESDLAFLRRMLARYDADLQVVGTELHVAPRGEVRRGAITLELHSQLLSARVLADLSHQVTQVTVAGWNAIQGQRVTGRSSGAHAGPGQGSSGADLLRQALSERAHHIAHLAVTTEAEARAAADAAFDARARRLVVIEGLAEGNSTLRVGTHVTINGLSPRFDNTYYVVRACHTFNQERGYQTSFEAECAFLGGN